MEIVNIENIENKKNDALSADLNITDDLTNEQVREISDGWVNEYKRISQYLRVIV